MNKEDAPFGRWLIACVSVLSWCLSANGGTMPPLVIAGTAQGEAAVGVAFNGSNFLIGIQGNDISPDGISAQLITQSGAVLSRTNLNVDGGFPALGFGGGRFLEVWGNAGDLYGQTLNPAGALVGTPFAICTVEGSQDVMMARIPFDGTNFLVVWGDERGNGDIYGRLVSTGGELVGAEIPIATNSRTERDVTVKCDGTNFLVVFSSEARSGTRYAPDVCGQFVSRSGSLIGTNFVIDQNDFPSDNGSSMAFDGSKYIVLFHDQMTNRASADWDIYARFVWPSGVVGTNRFPIAASTNEQEHFPGIAFDGSNVLITVQIGLNSDGFVSNACLRGRFFDTNLNAVTPWFTVLDARGTNEFPLIGVPCFGGGKYLVVVPTFNAGFNEKIDVYGVFVDMQMPAFGGIQTRGGAVTLSVTNLFQGGSNCVERSFSLGSTNWDSAGNFVSTSAITNWSEVLSNQWDKAFYRLNWK